MMIKLTQHENDSPNFISNIEIIISENIDKWNPLDLHLVRIDNWFDDKWLNFSGTMMHEISVWQQQEVTIPPFHPNRVEIHDYYQLYNGVYKKQIPCKKLHIIQESSHNFKRKIFDYTNNGLFIWYSGNSKINNKGALMIYVVNKNDCYTFYISLNGDVNCKVEKTKGIQAKEVQKSLNIIY